MKVTLLTTVIVILVLPLAGGCREKAQTSGWESDLLRERSLSVLAWGPSDNTIAFVATPIGKTDYEMQAGPGWAEIWLGRMDSDHDVVDLRRLVRLSREEGIPVAVFWVSDMEIGWAGAGTDAQDFGLLAADIDNAKVRKLFGGRFHMWQTRTHGEVLAPNDAMWDSASQELLFAAGVVGGDKASKEVLCIVRVERKGVEVVPLDSGMTGPVTFCRAREGQWPQLYIAGGRWTAGTGYEALIFSSPWDLRPHRIIARRSDGSLLFPRLSHDGEMLAWLSRGNLRGEPDELIVCHLKSGRRSTVAHVASAWKGTNPALGCPYCWAPARNEIVYVDGASINVVQVSPDTLQVE